jgi:hypothetical protein
VYFSCHVVCSTNGFFRIFQLHERHETKGSWSMGAAFRVKYVAVFSFFASVISMFLYSYALRLIISCEISQLTIILSILYFTFCLVV